LEKKKDWSAGVMEYWSGGKEKGLECWPPVRRAFTFLTLVMRDPDMVLIFPLYQPIINPLLHHSITPSLQHSRYD
jgi:hypothetical protein